MHRRFLITGAIFGLTAVIFGAFAAHGLKETISAESLNSFETGVRFQMYHAFLFLILGGFDFLTEKKINWVYYLLLTGVIFFSGSIYLLSTSSLSGIDFKSIALVTPLGGTLLILAWAILLLNFIKLKKK
ncbi:uncharacterized membrane protein YgdD (TMEM256/DUF423 family) [Christiangramia gaetbulicola]|uniref:Uncharacterized membrane protein YgdD (TMEM256/DUF423 family) n=1 Tax=Christiangramia gaetbulicola TaxID=703340 RepID=A0A2T6AL64_9FLAO|nr:DUF423 domain-containing protein [Christiangramia gaetbulicola]PTX44559.1 uncharacterized membrane protein YgdD (TMEM256/DUF423 family) [Christiangramia gaetbulicola]